MGTDPRGLEGLLGNGPPGGQLRQVKVVSITQADGSVKQVPMDEAFLLVLSSIDGNLNAVAKQLERFADEYVARGVQL